MTQLFSYGIVIILTTIHRIDINFKSKKRQFFLLRGCDIARPFEHVVARRLKLRIERVFCLSPNDKLVYL